MRGKSKSRRELPLSAEVGKAGVAYLRHGNSPGVSGFNKLFYILWLTLAGIIILIITMMNLKNANSATANGKLMIFGPDPQSNKWTWQKDMPFINGIFLYLQAAVGFVICRIHAH